MTPVKLEDLKYVLFPTPHYESAWLPFYEEAFRCWKKVWEETFKELDGAESVFSDDFCRQSFAGCLFFGARCLALGLFHEVDFNSSTARADSYFKVWPDGAVQKLIEDGKKVIVGSNITVDSEFRGDLGNGLQLKNVIVSLMVKTFFETTSDSMTGTMRVNRNMHRAAHRFGAVPLCSGIIHHGVEVELTAFYRKRLPSSCTSDLSAEVLWKNRLDFRLEQKEQTDDRYKKAR